MFLPLLALLACPPTITGDSALHDTGEAPDADGDGYLEPDDCEPLDPGVHPGAQELCDGFDNDCDGLVDELYDLDEDGYLADDPGCRSLGGEVDCDDLNPDVNPGATEVVNGIDDDCDGMADDAPDADGDGYNALADCDESDPFVNPGAPDACDAIDNDCDGAVDEDFDADGDGFSTCNGDCDDTDPVNALGIPEICDGHDNDCDGLIDEDFDADGDGWSTCEGDCDDTNAATNPVAEEICDGADNDCNPDTSDDGDVDGDGYTRCDGDCNDLAPEAHPGGVEVCDDLDNDCNDEVDELDTCWDCTDVGGYLVCTRSTTLEKAQAACGVFGGALFVPETASENTDVGNAAWAIWGTYFWFGLTDTASEGTWRFTDDSTPSYSGWCPGEPNDSGGEDCGTTNWCGIGTWNDMPCTSEAPFICEL